MDWNKCIMHYNTLTYRVHICGYKLHLDCLIKGRNLYKVKWCAAQQPCTLSIVPDNRISSEAVHHNLYPNFPCSLFTCRVCIKVLHPESSPLLFCFVFFCVFRSSLHLWSLLDYSDKLQIAAMFYLIKQKSCPINNYDDRKYRNVALFSLPKFKIIFFTFPFLGVAVHNTSFTF